MRRRERLTSKSKRGHSKRGRRVQAACPCMRRMLSGKRVLMQQVSWPGAAEDIVALAHVERRQRGVEGLRRIGNRLPHRAADRIAGQLEEEMMAAPLRVLDGRVPHVAGIEADARPALTRV